MADSSSNETLGELRESCRRLQFELDGLRERIRRLEQSRATPPPPAQSLPELLAREVAAKRASPPGPKPPIESPAPRLQSGPPLPPSAQPRRPTPAAAPCSAAKPAEAAASRDQKTQAVELLVGRTGLNLAGAIILLLAVGFFIKYSFDQGWLSETARVVIAGIAGLTLVGIGEFCLFRLMRAVAGGLIGCGIGVLYLAVFGSYNYYGLVDSQTAAVLYIGVTALSIVVSTHANLLPIATLALIGGFWTPLALRTGVDPQVALLTYILLLDAGFLICASIRRWDVLRPSCWLGTALLFGGWYQEFYHEAAMWRTAGFILAFYILLHGETLLALWRGTTRWTRFSGHMIHLNNIVFFTSIYFLMRDAIPDWMGLFAVTTAGVQWLAALRMRGQAEVVTPGRNALWLDGAAILTLAAPIQFDRYMVALSWAVQSAVTFLFCRGHERLFLRFKATGVLIAAGIHLWAIDRFDSELLTLIVDMGNWSITWFLIYGAFAGLCAYAGGTLLAARRTCGERDRSLAQLTYAIGSVLLLAAFAYQWDRYLASWGWLLVAAAWVFATRWTRAAIPSAVALTVAAAVKFVAWDTIAAMVQGTWAEIDSLVLSRPLITGILVAGLVSQVRPLCDRASDRTIAGLGFRPGPAMLFLSALLITWTGTFEIARIFRHSDWASTRFTDPEIAAGAFITGFWAINAVAVWFIASDRQRTLAAYALLLTFMTAAKFIIADSLLAAATGRWAALSGIAWNRGFLAGVATIAACLIAHFYVKRIAGCRDWPFISRSTERLMLGLSILMITWVCSFEIARVFRYESLPINFESADLAMHVALSIAWTVNASVLLIIGFVRWDKLIRLCALGLFAITIAKVFIFDLSRQVLVYRIISFGVLGVVLLMASLLYQRLSARFSESTTNPVMPDGMSG